MNIKCYNSHKEAEKYFSCMWVVFYLVGTKQQHWVVKLLFIIRERKLFVCDTGSIILVLMSYSCPWWSLQSLVTGQTMWVVNWISQYCIMSVSCCTGHWYVGTWTSDQVDHDSIQVSVTNIAQFCNVANFVATQFLSPHYCGVQLESYVG